MEAIKKSDLFYPSGLKWMWNYCTSLGKYTDEQGEYDLGIYIDQHGRASEASVCGNQPGNYWSGGFEDGLTNPTSHNRKLEVLTRAIKLGIINQMPMEYAV